MPMTDRSYFRSRADIEKLRAEAATSAEARLAHEQLHELYLVRAGEPVANGDFRIASGCE